MKICDNCKERPANAGLYTPSGFVFSKLGKTKEEYLCKHCAKNFEDLAHG